MTTTIAQLLTEYDRALAHTDDLWTDLTPAELHWRHDEHASAIGWHLGHQPAVAHYLVRNLTAAEPSLDAELDALMDSATAEPERGTLPDRSRLQGYRSAVAERLRFHIANIDAGKVGAPAQLRIVAKTLLVATINHEYQHDKWIGEVRSEAHGKDVPDLPTSDLLTVVEGYNVIVI
ncbi:MAG: DinB family protein [Acidimicrobiales bacterium]